MNWYVFFAALAVIIVMLWRQMQSSNLVALLERVIVAGALFVLVIAFGLTGLTAWVVFAVLVLYALGVLFWNFSLLELVSSRDTAS